MSVSHLIYSNTSSERGGIEGEVFGENISAGKFCAVCLESVAVLETSKTGVFSFGIDSMELLTFSCSPNACMRVDGQGARSEKEQSELSLYFRFAIELLQNLG